MYPGYNKLEQTNLTTGYRCRGASQCAPGDVHHCKPGLLYTHRRNLKSFEQAVQNFEQATKNCPDTIRDSLRNVFILANYAATGNSVYSR